MPESLSKLARRVGFTEKPIVPTETSPVTRNAIYNLVGQVALLGLGLLSAHFVLRGLGHDAFGLILFATTLTAVLSGLLELGVIATTVRVVAMHSRDPRYLAAYVGTSSTLYWGIYGLLVASGYLLAPLIVMNWIHLSSLSAETAIEGVRLLLLGSFSVLPRNLYASLFRGFQRTEFNNAIEVAASALQQIGTVTILFLGGELITVALWMVVMCTITLVTYMMMLTKLLPLRVLAPGFSRRVIQDHWRYAASASGSSILMMLFMQADKVVISKLLALSAFGYYSFAWASVWKVATLTTVVSQASFPSMAALYRSRATADLLHEYRRLHCFVCHIAVVPIAAVAFAALPVLSFLFGEGVAVDLLIPIALLSLASYMYATLTMPMAVAAAGGRPELLMRVNLVALFTFLPALIILVAAWGLSGAGLAWLGYYCLAYAFLVPPVCRQCLGLSAATWYGDMARVYVRLLSTYATAWTLCLVFGKHSVFIWVLGFATATIVFVLVAYPTLTGASRNRRRELQSSVRRLA